MPPYFPGDSDWRETVRGRWLLLDANAVILIAEFGADSIFSELESLSVTSCHIHPVLLELRNTNDLAARIARMDMVKRYSVGLSFGTSELSKADQVQLALPPNCQPSAVDLYLAGTIARYSGNNMLLLTENLKDFPSPLFSREGYIVLQQNNKSRSLGLLSFNHSILPEA